MTVQVMWKVPAWEQTFKLPQQTVIIRTASQRVFTKCSSFQIILLQSSSLLFEAIFSLIILLHVKTSNVILTYSNNYLNLDNFSSNLLRSFNCAADIVNVIEEKGRKFLNHSMLNETYLRMLIAKATKTSVKL